MLDSHQAGFAEMTELKLISFWRERLAEPEFRNVHNTEVLVTFNQMCLPVAFVPPQFHATLLESAQSRLPNLQIQ